MAEDLENKKCRICAMCGRNENDGELEDPTPWLCSECRTFLHVIRNYICKKIQDQEHQEAYIKGITKTQANEMYNAWFCNFCKYNNLPCAQDPKKQKECITKKIEKCIRKFGDERGWDWTCTKLNKVGVVCVREKHTCVGCGKEIAVGDTAATWAVSYKGDDDRYINEKYYMCLMCVRKYVRRAEKEEI